jgi:RNA methyltransferase, TrmH family
MLSKNQQKLIASMAQKKQRDLQGLFLAEGEKNVQDLLEAGLKPKLLVSTNDWKYPEKTGYDQMQPVIVDHNELMSASLLQSPKDVIAIFHKPQYHLNNNAIKDTLLLGLDGIQDPGNLGTIIRLADWFGIFDIICSPDTADVFNPKVVQATMGAIARVRVHYTPLDTFINQYRKETSNRVLGTFLDGKSIYSIQLPAKGIIIMGNEGNGIRGAIESMVTDKITIPSYPGDVPGSESLNVGVATAIVCAEFRRQMLHS